MTTYLYPHAPRPPFEQIGPAIFPSSISRSYGLSEASQVSATIALVDVRDLHWILPGACWRVEQPDLGEPLWAGFVSQEEVPLQADTYTLLLKGPKESLLNVEMAIDLSLRSSAPFAARQAIISTQARQPSILAGNIDRGGTEIEIQARAETVSAFIDTLRQLDPSFDWRERTVFSSGTLTFYLDFGVLQRPTTIVVERSDLVTGLFTRTKPPSSLTVLGAADRFRERERTTVAVSGATSPAFAADPSRTILRPRVDAVTSRAIGPAAVQHLSEVQERVATDIPGFASTRYEELLRGIDKLLLTFDGTTATGKAVQVGDLVHLNVPSWIPGLDVMTDVHIRHCSPQDAVGDRDMEAQVLL